jgi:hypothetical protein
MKTRQFLCFLTIRITESSNALGKLEGDLSFLFREALELCRLLLKLERILYRTLFLQHARVAVVSVSIVKNRALDTKRTLTMSLLLTNL